MERVREGRTTPVPGIRCVGIMRHEDVIELHRRLGRVADDVLMRMRSDFLRMPRTNDYIWKQSVRVIEDTWGEAHYDMVCQHVLATWPSLERDVNVALGYMIRERYSAELEKRTHRFRFSRLRLKSFLQRFFPRLATSGYVQSGEYFAQTRWRNAAIEEALRSALHSACDDLVRKLPAAPRAQQDKAADTLLGAAVHNLATPTAAGAATTLPAVPGGAWASSAAAPQSLAAAHKAGHSVVTARDGALPDQVGPLAARKRRVVHPDAASLSVVSECDSVFEDTVSVRADRAARQRLAQEAELVRQAKKEQLEKEARAAAAAQRSAEREEMAREAPAAADAGQEARADATKKESPKPGETEASSCATKTQVAAGGEPAQSAQVHAPPPATGSVAEAAADASGAKSVFAQASIASQTNTARLPQEQDGTRSEPNRATEDQAAAASYAQAQEAAQPSANSRSSVDIEPPSAVSVAGNGTHVEERADAVMGSSSGGADEKTRHPWAQAWKSVVPEERRPDGEGEDTSGGQQVRASEPLHLAQGRVQAAGGHKEEENKQRPPPPSSPQYKIIPLRRKQVADEEAKASQPSSRSATSDRLRQYPNVNMNAWMSQMRATQREAALAGELQNTQFPYTVQQPPSSDSVRTANVARDAVQSFAARRAPMTLANAGAMYGWEDVPDDGDTEEDSGSDISD